MSLNFCFIGAGNLATQLAKALFSKGHHIVQVFSRTETSASTLAQLVNADFTTNPAEIVNSSDVYFIAIKDSAFSEVLPKIDFGNRLVVHCSGSVLMNVLENYSNNFGVFYPLQTFSKQRNVDFKNIPVFIEANNRENEELLLNIAAEISEKVTILDSERRRTLHVSAVFACNFVNHLYHIAGNILKSKAIDFDVLRPLILETALKVQAFEPAEVQTGPAVRFDENIINLHLAELSGMPEYQQLYETISKRIFEQQKK
ncbi:MAG TPA: DUF2520 domain-containing protein [Prolixibacteraceae bacterium]|nr:DUF2520 domain-containing protein [Prolixibacteraceae bacterium]